MIIYYRFGTLIGYRSVFDFILRIFVIVPLWNYGLLYMIGSQKSFSY